MPFVKAAAATDLAPDSVIESEIDGNPYAICNLGGELRAFDGVCPHAGGPLGQGSIDSGNLICPWHAWEYDALTGVNTFDDTCQLASFPVKIEGGDILVDIP
ncbi:MAG TPA: Rieske 2Fe-2S domain-containing protein [Bryobacteraceae bacterium]|nr:Rieske 2Fe-2S domain-containing protein [Bryobacteraceae bacterium]